MRKPSFFLITLAAVSIFLFAAITESQETVKVISVKGSPKIIKLAANEWVLCKADMVIENGDRIKTLGNEVVEISFAKNGANIIRIEENSDVFVKKTQAPYSVELLNGEVMSLIKNLPKDSAFEIRTPAGLSGSRGTGWRSQTDGLKATFDVFEDSIYAKGIDQAGNVMKEELIVERGWRTIVDKFEKPSRLEKLSSQDFERWNRWKEDLAGKSQERFERTSRIESRIEELAAKKEDSSERRDLNRIEKRLESKTTTSSGGGTY
jgi:hypothetical protein